MIKSCIKSDEHIKVLNNLWNNNQVNKNKIIQEFVRTKIAYKSGGDYSLTPLGRLTACFVLKNFKSKSGSKDIIIQRPKVIDEITYHIKKDNNVFMSGEKGIGKTILLKSLNKSLSNSVLIEPKPVKLMLEKIALMLDISLRRKKRLKRINELMEDIESYLKIKEVKIILLIDDVQDITKSMAGVLKKLERLGVVIIGAGRKASKYFDYDQHIRLQPLSNAESINFIKLLLGKDIDNSAVEMINKRTAGNPEIIKKSCKDLTRSGTDLNNEKSKTEYFTNAFINNYRKINLISKNNFYGIAFLLLALRYVFYGQDQFRVGYLFAMSAYIILFIVRWQKTKKQ